MLTINPIPLYLIDPNLILDNIRVYEKEEIEVY
jgi:hypothetical protein